MKKALAVLVLIAFAGLVAWQAYRNAASNTGASRGPGNAAVPIEIAPVTTGSLVDVGALYRLAFRPFLFRCRTQSRRTTHHPSGRYRR